MMRQASSPDAPAWLALLAFIEGIFFPIPPDVMLAPMVLARRDRAWRYAAICLSASVLGGSIGYTVGFFLHPVGIWLLSLTGSDPHEFEHWYRQWGVLLLALPLPYKLMAIASGLFKLPFPLFFGASIVHPRHALLPGGWPDPPATARRCRRSSRSGSAWWSAASRWR